MFELLRLSIMLERYKSQSLLGTLSTEPIDILNVASLINPSLKAKNLKLELYPTPKFKARASSRPETFELDQALR